MNDSKLLITLRTFNVYELNQLYKFVHSPFFNSNKFIESYFDILYTYLKNKSADELNKNEIFKNIFDEEYNDTKFRKLNTDLLKIVEEFLITNSFQNNRMNKATYLLEALKNRKIEKLYKSSIKNAQILRDREFERSSSFYFFNYQVEKIIFDMTEFDYKRSVRTNIEAISENLDIFYITEKLRFYIDMLSRKQFVTHQYNLLFMDEILNHIEKNDVSIYPTINVYYHILQSQIHSENVEYYYTLKELIRKHISSFSLQEGTQILGSAMNYCVGQINNSKQEFLKEFYDLMREYLDKEYFYSDGKLNPFVFKNIIVTGLRLKEYDFVENFIYDYKDKLPEDFQENAINYNLAQLYFYKKDFKRVLLNLTNLDYNDISYNLGARSILVASYYELDEYDALQSAISSFYVYLSRAKGTIPDRRRKNYIDFLKFVKNMSYYIPGDKKKKKKLIADFEKSTGVASAVWLKEKLDEL